MTKTMHHDVRGLIGSLTTSIGTIIGWQTQLEFWLRIASLCIGIIAGIYTIIHYAKTEK